jgi:hypothetical protein
MSDGRAGRMTEDDAVREQFTGDGIMSVFSAPKTGCGCRPD